MATWVIGDVHGCYNTFKTLLKNPEIKPEDTIILIGDIIDRGNDSVKMIKWAMKNVTENGKYQMIVGNHEDLVIHSFRECGFRHNDLSKVDISELNSQYDFCEYMAEAGYKTVESVREIIEWFASLPLHKNVTVNGQEYIIAHGWYSKRQSRDDILWGRDIGPFGELVKDYSPERNEILIHGHTPTLVIDDLIGELNAVLFREHSINIDCGCVWLNAGGNLAAIRLEDQKVIYARQQRKITP